MINASSVNYSLSFMYVSNFKNTMTITTYPKQFELSSPINNGPESIDRAQAIPQMGDETSISQSTAEEGLGSQTQQQTTNFTADGIIVESNVVKHHTLPALLHRSSDSNNSQDVKAFLAKPYKLWSGVLSTSDTTANSLLTGYNPSNLTVLSDAHAHKLSGYLGFRATLVLRWVINGTPFHQGRYMLWYVPLGGGLSNTKASDFVNLHTNTLFERTQLHRIELDVTCDTEGVMRIPYSSVLNYYPLANDNAFNFIGNLGLYGIQPYSPLQTLGGSSTIGSTLYGHLEDVELIGAAVPQMGNREISSTEKESKAAKIGPVSSTILSFSKAANVLSEVPLLSTFASTTGWALDIIGRTAKAAGFSKPQDYGPQTRMIAQPASNIGSVEGYDTSVTLGASSENQVAVLPGFGGTDIDEMSIKHIASIPAFFGTFGWGAEVVGDVLTSFDLRPDIFQQVRTIGTLPVYNHTPVSFIGNMFTYWRGSFVFKFKIVKTIFHSGRISVCFNPFDNKIAPRTITAMNEYYVHREIIDIRTCNEFTFTVPYVNVSPWLDSGESFGSITVFVIDKLSAPSNVPAAISFFMEVAGGDDMEFSVPSAGVDSDALGSNGMPFIGALPQMGEPCDLLNTTIGSDNVGASSLINSEVCIGEKINSLRSLSKIFRPQRLTSTIASGIIESSLPFSTHTVYWDGSVLHLPNTYGDFLDMISLCYLYSRGSVRIKKMNTFVGDTTPFLASFTSYNSGNVINQQAFGRDAADRWNRPMNVCGLNGGRYTFSNLSKTNGFIEVTVPQSIPRHSRLTFVESHNVTTGRANLPPSLLGCGWALNTYGFMPAGAYPLNSTGIALQNYRAAGDDFSLGNFVSTVPTTYIYTAGGL